MGTKYWIDLGQPTGTIAKIEFQKGILCSIWWNKRESNGVCSCHWIETSKRKTDFERDNGVGLEWL